MTIEKFWSVLLYTFRPGNAHLASFSKLAVPGLRLLLRPRLHLYLRDLRNTVSTSDMTVDL